MGGHRPSSPGSAVPEKLGRAAAPGSDGGRAELTSEAAVGELGATDEATRSTCAGSAELRRVGEHRGAARGPLGRPCGRGAALAATGKRGGRADSAGGAKTRRLAKTGEDRARPARHGRRGRRQRPDRAQGWRCRRDRAESRGESAAGPGARRAAPTAVAAAAASRVQAPPEADLVHTERQLFGTPALPRRWPRRGRSRHSSSSGSGGGGAACPTAAAATRTSAGRPCASRWSRRRLRSAAPAAARAARPRCRRPRRQRAAPPTRAARNVQGARAAPGGRRRIVLWPLPSRPSSL